MGSVDAQKLHSSMTLFALAAPDQPVFREVLDHYFGGDLEAAVKPFAEVAAIVQEMRFYPALEKGKEQPGVAKVSTERETRSSRWMDGCAGA